MAKPDAAKLNLFRCHKEVRAAMIDRLEEDGYGGITMHLVGGEKRTAAEELFVRYQPEPGDFYVVYSDGYESISPAKAFIDGYTMISDGPAAAVAPDADSG